MGRVDDVSNACVPTEENKPSAEQRKNHTSFQHASTEQDQNASRPGDAEARTTDGDAVSSRAKWQVATIGASLPS